MTDEPTAAPPAGDPGSAAGKAGTPGGIVVPVAAALLWFVLAVHFLSPPDCLAYWAWAETLVNQGSFNFIPSYEHHQMPTFYVWMTPHERLSNDWPIGSGLALLPVVKLGTAIAHAWVVLWVIGALSLWWRASTFPVAARRAGLLAVLLATPLFFYSMFGPFFSHPFSFALATAFLVAWERSRKERLPLQWLMLGLLLGFASLVRPQNVLLALVLLSEVPAWLRRRSTAPALVSTALFALGALLAFSPQLMAWWAIYGSPLAMPKLDEMHWEKPFLRQLLFSDFHGVVPWTPIFLAVLPGLVLLRRRDPSLAGGLALVLGSQIYINAANIVWWAGGSFGNRRLTDVSIVVAYAVAAIWQETAAPAKPQAHPASAGGPRWLRSAIVRVGLRLLIVACVLWTVTLLTAERRGTLPLDRYVTLWDRHTLMRLMQVWTQPVMSLPALARPAAEALAQPWLTPGGGLTRVAGAVLVGLGTWLLSRAVASTRDAERVSRRMPLVMLAVAVVFAGATGIAAWRTPPVTDPVVREMVGRHPGILWDNFIELAYYEIMQGRPQRCALAARRAIALRPRPHTGWWYLGVALRDLGKKRDALHAFDRVLSLNPGHPGAVQEREELLAKGVGERL